MAHDAVQYVLQYIGSRPFSARRTGPPPAPG